MKDLKRKVVVPVEDGEPARHRCTIGDIARLAGISKRTVSRVINGNPHVSPEVQQRVEALIREHGFVPNADARALATKRSALIGMIYDNANAEYIVNLQRGVLDILTDRGVGLVVHRVDHSAPDYVDELRAFVRRQKLIGAIVPPSLSEDDRFASMLIAEGCDSVRIAAVPFDRGARMVITHDYLGGRVAARHLVKLGHRVFGYIAGPPHFRSSRERRRGFEDGLAEAGLVLDASRAKTGAYTYESGVVCGHELLAMAVRPTAIFAGNDEMACGVYAAARERGLNIPVDLSVVGYDDSPVAQVLLPALTTVLLPTREMGRAAAQMLLTSLESGPSNQAVAFAPVLVERQSASRPPVL